MAGGAAIAVPVSIWLVACVFFLCLFLGLIKRLSDLTSQAENSSWQPAAPYRDVPELSWMLSVVGTLTVGGFLSYSLSSHTAQLFGARGPAFAMLTPLVIIALFRFYRRAVQGLSDRPLDAFREDHGVQVSCLLFAMCSVAILYLPGLDHWLEKLFLL
jgi:4-hydroxybenzoate polyprenyltransferase